jgi:hypothetical protein
VFCAHLNRACGRLGTVADVQKPSGGGSCRAAADWKYSSCRGADAQGGRANLGQIVPCLQIVSNMGARDRIIRWCDVIDAATDRLGSPALAQPIGSIAFERMCERVQVRRPCQRPSRCSRKLSSLPPTCCPRQSQRNPQELTTYVWSTFGEASVGTAHPSNVALATPGIPILPHWSRSEKARG